MAKVKIPYYVVPKGKRTGYWQPSEKMRGLGFESVPCGIDGPEAWAVASKWNERWQRFRKGEDVAPEEQERRNLNPEETEARAVYPSGTVGDAFKRYREMDAWKLDKAPKTRDDWWRGWRYIKPIFADVDPSTIEPETADQWYRDIKNVAGLREAHRALKIWRALWKVMAAFKLCDKDKDPSATTRNKTPKGRTETWTEGEAVRLVKRAWRSGDKGLACVMATVWDTAFSPVDGRTVAPSQWFSDSTGSFFVKFRQKTENADKQAIEAIGTLSKRTERLIEAYLGELGADLMPDVPMFRNQKGTPYSKDSLARAFARNREAEFPADKRQLLDFRRSGSQEMQAGDIDPLALSTKLSNSISYSKLLQETYLPKRATTVRVADEARKKGRTRLRGERAMNKKFELAGQKSLNSKKDSA